MIELIPAIDLYGGACVRLRQGKFEYKTQYSVDPVNLARQFERLGVKRLHLVDLEGARKGTPKNLDVLRKISENTSLQIDFGGGIREEEDIRNIFLLGAKWITIGSVAVNNPALVRKWLGLFGPDRFILAADSKDEKVPVYGWQRESEISVFDLIRQYQDMGIEEVMCTDISRDGMMQGINPSFYPTMRLKFPGLKLIASGGISTFEDIKSLQDTGMEGAIIGKAIFEKGLDMGKVMDQLKQQQL